MFVAAAGHFLVTRVYMYIYTFKVVVSNIFYKKSPLPGEMIQFHEHIFQLGLKPPTSIYIIYILNIYIYIYILSLIR